MWVSCNCYRSIISTTSESTSEWSKGFGFWCKKYHEFVCLALSILGCIAIALNLIVLKSNKMRTPTSTILSALAVLYLLIVVEKMALVIFLKLSHSSVTGFRLEANQFHVLSQVHCIFYQVC